MKKATSSISDTVWDESILSPTIPFLCPPPSNFDTGIHCVRQAGPKLTVKSKLALKFGPPVSASHVLELQPHDFRLWSKGLPLPLKDHFLPVACNLKTTLLLCLEHSPCSQLSSEIVRWPHSRFAHSSLLALPSCQLSP